MIIHLPSWNPRLLQSYISWRVWRKQFSAKRISAEAWGTQQQNQSFDSPPHAAVFVVSSRLQLIWQPKKFGFASSTWCLKGWGYLYQEQTLLCHGFKVKSAQHPPVPTVITKSYNLVLKIAFMKIEVFISFRQLLVLSYFSLVRRRHFISSL